MLDALNAEPSGSGCTQSGVIDFTLALLPLCIQWYCEGRIDELLEQLKNKMLGVKGVMID